jgi:hypothetical protein
MAEPPAPEAEEPPVVEPEKTEIRVSHWVYLEVPWDEFLQDDGTYLVPVDYLDDRVGSFHIVLFEGEFADEIGIHAVCTLFAEDGGDCIQEDGDLRLANQGSFWDGERVSSRARADNLDDLRMAFGHDKWQNWESQEIEGNPIEVYLSYDRPFFEAGDEPVLDPDQRELVERNADQRCSGFEPIEETPLSDAEDNAGMVVGAPGSYSCTTLFVGKLTADGQIVGLWWQGARDGFAYYADGASFYLVPDSWDEAKIESFATEMGAEVFGP